jgi:hypothetical protein
MVALFAENNLRKHQDPSFLIRKLLKLREKNAIIRLAP